VLPLAFLIWERKEWHQSISIMRMQKFALQFPLKDNKGVWGEGANTSALSSLQSSNKVTALLDHHTELSDHCTLPAGDGAGAGDQAQPAAGYGHHSKNMAMHRPWVTTDTLNS
jgi:hypothetical protein